MMIGLRPLVTGDLPRVRALAARCDARDGTDELRFVDALEDRFSWDSGADKWGCIDAGGADAAGCARVTSAPGEYRSLLSAWVDPPDTAALRDVLEWCCARGTESAAGLGGWLRMERVLRAETADLPVWTTETYQSLGFDYFMSELEMTRDVARPAPGAPIAGVSIIPWAQEQDAAIRDTYNDAFRERGFRGYDAHEWVDATFSAQDTFRRDLSFLALDGQTLAGFCLCARAPHEPGVAWVDTLGVRPSHRRRGVASAVLLQALASMRDAGIATAALRVNVDNARAIALYRGIGFAMRRKHVVWRRPIVQQ